MAELVAELARRLVDEPDAVRVEEFEDEDGTLVWTVSATKSDDTLRIRLSIALDSAEPDKERVAKLLDAIAEVEEVIRKHSPRV